MRFFWKLLLVAIPLGSYWLYKKSGPPSRRTDVQPGQSESSRATESGSSPGRETTAKKSKASPNKEERLSSDQIIEQLTEIDGVTRRVAENLVERGIKSREALLELSEEELKSIKGIGPKRAARILNLG